MAHQHQKYEPVLGELIEGVAFRDCVHVAVAPVESADTFCPGEWAHLDENGRATNHGVGDPPSQPVGVVDPFLKDVVRPGQRFWLFLKPGSITSIRHAWQHPAFAPKMPRREVSDDV